MLNFSLTRRIVVLVVCLFGLVFASPNLFYDRVEGANDARIAIEQGFVTDANQAAAGEWPGFLPSGIVNLGLDLRGGAHLLAEVQVEDVYDAFFENLWPEVRDALRPERDLIGSLCRVGTARCEAQDLPRDQLRVEIGNSAGMTRAIELTQALSQPVISLTGLPAQNFNATTEGDTLVITLSDEEKLAVSERTLVQSLEIIRRRVDEAGTREPTIQRQGADRVLIQVPGIDSAEELKDIIGKTAKLTFHTVVSTSGDSTARVGADEVLFPEDFQGSDVPSTWYVLKANPVIEGEHLTDAQAAFDQNNRPAVNFRLNPTGGRIFGEYTAENIGRPFAIVLDDKVVSAPVIQSHIPGGSGIITGQFSVEETATLAIQLRAGALPASVIYLEERTVGPELGQDSIDAGRLATMVAFIAVLVFMFLSYGRFGLYANIALILNVCLIFALLYLIGATLTLPGIAGIVLTIGMAVDANVLVFERIREELKRAKGVARAIELGYERAFSAIIDANITTFIAAVILYAMGSGPVRGFAITLGIGIITSVFTAIWVTRLMIIFWLERNRPKKLEL
ncbi:MAG: protein translocase subunit SecD [Pseudomonadota bacterium]